MFTEPIGYQFVKGIWYYQTHDDTTGKWGLIEPQESGESPSVPRPPWKLWRTSPKVGCEEAFQFTATYTGKIEELKFRTNGTANTGVSSVVLGVFAGKQRQTGGSSWSGHSGR